MPHLSGIEVKGLFLGSRLLWVKATKLPHLPLLSPWNPIRPVASTPGVIWGIPALLSSLTASFPPLILGGSLQNTTIPM